MKYNIILILKIILYYNYMSSDNLSSTDIFNSTSEIIPSTDIDLSKLGYIKVFKVLVAALTMNFIFSTILYFFFYGQISNAKSYTDYFYFGLSTLTTAGYVSMAPITRLTKTFISLYLIFIFSVMLSTAL